MRGDIEHIGVPPVPSPLGKTLHLVLEIENITSFNDFTSPPPLQKKKVLLKKKLQLFQNLFDDDFKESVKGTNVQKCDFSQS